MSIETLKEKAKSYNISQEYLDSKEKGRLEFLAKFPKDKISKLTLDEYVLGNGKESFCYWLEFKKIDDKVIVFGIGGGNASKFGLYKSKDGLYQTGYGRNKKALSGKDLDDYFNSIKDTIILALKCLEEDRIKEIKQMDIPFGNMILQKILSIYYPEKFITIGASNVLIDFAKDIKLQKIELTPNNLIEINFECKRAIDKLPEFLNWPYEKIGTFIWENYGPIEEEKSNSSKIRYWLYAPGENAELWNEFYEKGLMGLGWDELGDLNNYSSKEELTTKLQELEKTTGSKKNDSTANFEFKDVISIGDIIISKKGRGQLLGYGVVTSDYYYDKERTRYQKCRKVNWEKNGNWKTDHSLALKTLTDITNYPSEHPDYEKYYDKLLGIMNNNKVCKNYKEEYTLWLNKTYQNDGGTKSSYIRAIEILSTIVKYNIFEKDEINKIDFLYEDLIQEQRVEGGKYYHKEAPSYGNQRFYSAAIKTYSDFLKQYKKPNTMTFMEPLNTILFGPPGTGKTFNSINKAISIVNPGFNTKQDRKLVKEEYDRLEKDNRILFSTFHQSMSYEDFIEGIKPLPPKSNEPLNYDIQAGIFKIACARAAYLCYKTYNQAKGVGKSNYTFDDLYNAFIESIKPSIKNNQFPTYKTITKKDVEIYEVNSQDSIKARAKGSKATHVAPLTQENLEKLYNKYNSASEIKNLDEIRDTVQVSPRSTEFYAVFDGLKQFEKTYKPDNKIIEEDVVVDTTEDAEKIKKFTAGIYNDSIKQFGKNAEPIVLIIDEINRGNVSQIFGELITLIEDDKRIGKSESLEVILPYSKLKFGVPPNLHLVGTMNTADRSVEALDTALRRRFVFEEIPPKYDLTELQYEYAEVKAFEILQTINKRIEKLLDKDHLIGHSYFILKDGESPNEKLKNSFYKSILPLLQEYFFGDFGKIGLVLGQGFVNLKNWDDKVDSFAEFEHESSGDFENKDVYEIIDYREPTNYEVNKVKMDFEKAIKRLMKLNIA
jgi:5-methylcytosine-specific restriction endonuclease McrBC GTP-binding regulatory subunit McrB